MEYIENDAITIRNFDFGKECSNDNDVNLGFFINGGGTKGVFAIGVIKYLFEKNPHLD